MSVELGSVLAASQAVGPVELLAGPAECQVAAVAALTPDAEPEAGGLAGAFVIVLGQIPKAGWPMDAFLRRCGDAGAVAVAFPPGPVDAGSLRLAGRLGLALVRSHQPWRLSVHAHNLINGTVDQQVGAMTRALVQALQQAGGDLEDLLAAAARAAGREFLLLDTMGRGLLGEVAWTPADQAVLELPCPRPPWTSTPCCPAASGSWPAGSN